MSRSCTECEAAAPLNARFCMSCGTPLGAEDAPHERSHLADSSSDRRRPDPWLTDTRPITLIDGELSPRGESRQITVLFVDLVDSMGLSHALDDEDFADIVYQYRMMCRKVVEANDGHLAQMLGDGVLAYFGFPYAHDDDPARAVRCGQGIIEGLEEVRAHAQLLHKVSINVRIGVHTGRVVLSELGNDAQLAMGKVPNIAARIQDQAEPNTVAMSARTKRLVDQWFDVESMGMRRLKGVEQEVELFRALSDRGVSAHLRDVRHQHSAKFVGRVSEMAQLEARWQASKSGPTLTTIRGEAGVGKSRLIREFRARVEDTQAITLGCFCSPYYRGSPLRAIADMLERMLGISTTPDEERVPALRAWAAQGPMCPETGEPILNHVIPMLSTAIAYPSNDAQPSHRRYRTLRSLADGFAHMTRDRRVLLCVEDVHWADPTTLELIQMVLERGSNMQLCIVATMRPAFSPPWSGPQTSLIDLAPMDPESAKQMLVQISGKPLSGALLMAIMERAGGIPLFLEELLVWALKSPHVVDAGTHWHLADQSKLELRIPDTLEAVLMTHLDRLGGAKVFAQVAAVLGREFRLDLLAAVTRTSEEHAQLALDALVHSGTVLEKSRAGNTIYVFKHALLRDAAYTALLKRTRQEFHERTVEALQQRFPDIANAKPEVLALHLEEAGEPGEAFEYWKRAAFLAHERAASAEAVEFARKALAHLRSQGNGHFDETRAREELALQRLLAPALMATLGWASADVAVASERARALAAELEDHEAVFGALWGIWMVHFLRGTSSNALEAAEQTAAMAQRFEAPIFKLTAHHALGFTHHYIGNFETALDHAERGLSMFDMELERAITDSFHFSSSGAMAAYGTVSAWMLGRFETCQAMERKWLALVDELDHLPSTAFAWSFRLYLQHARGDIPGVRASAQRLLAAAQAEGFLLWIAVAQIFSAWADCMLGHLDPASAAQALDEAVVMFRATGTRIILVEVAGMTYEVRMRAGDTEGALEALEAGIAEAYERGEGLFLPELHRLRGELALQRSEPNPEAHFEAAWEVANKQNAHALGLRAATTAAALWPTPRWIERAQDAWSKVEPLETERDVQNARKLLA